MAQPGFAVSPELRPGAPQPHQWLWPARPPQAHQWLWPARPPQPDDTLVLFFPFAGGSAASFRGWARRLPAGHVFVGVELPGRGRRAREPYAVSYEEVIAGITAELESFTQRRLVLFGHSMGAELAYELTLALEGGARRPALAVISAGRAPSTGLGRPPIAHLPLPEFLAAAVRDGLAAPELATYPQLAEIYGPVLQADLRLVEQRGQTAGTPTSVPLVLFGSRQDRLVPEQVLRKWSALAAAPPTLHLFDGGHMFILERADLVSATLVDLLEQTRGNGGRPAPL